MPRAMSQPGQYAPPTAGAPPKGCMPPQPSRVKPEAPSGRTAMAPLRGGGATGGAVPSANALSAAWSQQKFERSTAPVMPGTPPDEVNCHIRQPGQAPTRGVVGVPTLYSAIHSG